MEVCHLPRNCGEALRVSVAPVYCRWLLDDLEEGSPRFLAFRAGSPGRNGVRHSVPDLPGSRAVHAWDAKSLGKKRSPRKHASGDFAFFQGSSRPMRGPPGNPGGPEQSDAPHSARAIPPETPKTLGSLLPSHPITTGNKPEPPTLSRLPRNSLANGIPPFAKIKSCWI